MPRRALRTVVEVDIRTVSAPGVWLPSREDVYLSISFLGQYFCSRVISPIFPLVFNERFRFEKTYYAAVDPAEVADHLEDELIVFEMVQLNELGGGGTRLAAYSTNGREFIYPFPSLKPSSSKAPREILMGRTINFPGISPKIEFTTQATIKESHSPEFDALDDAIDKQKAALRKLKKYVKSSSRPSSRLRRPSSKYGRSSVRHSHHSSRHSRPVSRNKTRSPICVTTEMLEDMSLNDPKDPFVVRQLDKSLIARNPGSPPNKSFLDHQKKNQRSLSRRNSLSKSRDQLDDDDDSAWTYTPLTKREHLRKVFREPGTDPLPVYETRLEPYSDEDEEVAELLERAPDPIIDLPRRSASPLMYRPSLHDRFSSGQSYARPSSASSLSRRARSIDRLSKLSRCNSYQSDSTDSLDELEREFRQTRHRSLVHLDNGHYWSEKAAQYKGRSHRHVFNDSLGKLYSRLYKQATSNGIEV